MPISMFVGQSLTVTPQRSDNGGTAYTPIDKIEYATSNDQLAIVSPSGVVKALQPGTVTITAVNEGINGAVTIIVSAQPSVIVLHTTTPAWPSTNDQATSVIVP